MKINIFDRLSFLALFFVIALLPIFFLPFTYIPVEISKGLLLVVGITLSIVFWVFARFFDGRIVLPKSKILLAGLGIVLVFLISTFVSHPSQVSFFGTMFDLGSFMFIFSGFLLMLFSSIIFKDLKKAKILLFVSVLVGAVVLIFQSVHLFLPTQLSLGVFLDKTDNIIGSWNAFAIFAGLISLLSLLVVEFFPTSKIEKLLLQILILLSLFLVAVVNFPLVWILIGIFSLIIFVYKVSIISKNDGDQNEENKRHFPVFSFIIIMVSLLFFMAGNLIGGILPNYFKLSNVEIGPSFSSTIDITKSVIKESPIVGTGPNSFSGAWSKYKPLSINTTAFWDTTFNFGSGLLPTLLATTGILGILSMLSFFVLFILSGVKSIFSSIKNGVNWETMAFFVLSLYLFVSAFFYSVGSVIFLLALAFAGVFIGLSHSGEDEEIVLSFSTDHKKNFFSILFLVFIILVSMATSFEYIKSFTSIFYYSKTLRATSIDSAETSINKTLSLYSNDLYLRTYSQVYLQKMSSLVKSGATTLSDADKATLQSSLNQAIAGAQGALLYNPKNYLNYQELGNLYQNLIVLGVKDAYPKAIDAYTSAVKLNPNNPGLELSMATASINFGKIKEAEGYANTALGLKPDYVDALVTLSQIAKNKGNNADALDYAQRALSLDPTNKDLIQYVQSLKGGTLTSAPTTTQSTTTSTGTKTKN